MSKRRVVVTGLGAITPVGHTLQEFWDGVLAMKSGAGPITLFDASRHKVRFACEIKNYDPLNHFDRKEARRHERFVQFALIAAKEAIENSGLELEKENRERIGTMIGAGVGGLNAIEEQCAVLLEKGPDRVSALLITRLIANMGAGQVSINFGLQGPNSCPVTACATATHSIGDAARLIQHGYADAMVAGGTEAAITPLGIAGFQNMKALSTRNDSPETASRPFSKDRDGFVMGEGSGVLVLEEYERAKARGANILAEFAGYGMSGDAHHITAPAPEHAGAQRSMRAALEDAGLTPTDISSISAHGTSTPLNDKLETAALKHVFGDHAYKLTVSSIKSSIGHLLGAAGGVGAAASVLSLMKDIVAPTMNYLEADPDCDLDYVTEGPRSAPQTAIMSNSFGFGGHNASVIFKKV